MPERNKSYTKIHATEMQALQHESTSKTEEANNLRSSGYFHRNGDSVSHNNSSGHVSRIGRYQVAMLLASTMVCFGCLAFLTFLWGADTNNAVWRRLILRNWATRSITIASLVLRWATGVQAITCTSMLAATLLKVGTISLAKSAAVSITRYDNTGPWSLLNLMGAKWYSGSSLVGLLTLLFCLTTLLLQFSSTILLSHVGLGYLPAKSVSEKTYYGFDRSGSSVTLDTGAVSFLQSTPSVYPAFAEYIFNQTMTGPGNFSRGFEPSNTPSMRDTGTVLRAFLPIRDPDERSLTTQYEGIATVVDTRVVCMKPNLTNVGWFYDGLDPRLYGQAKLDTFPPGGSRSSNDILLTFDCGFTAAEENNYTAMYKEWPLGICRGIYLNDSQGMFVFY
jgi:hypothetical protein